MTIDISDLRQRVLAGEKLTPELSRQVVEYLRGERMSAAQASAASKSRKRTGIDEQATMADLDAALGL